MDMGKLLGGLLKHKSGAGGGVGKLLQDLLGGGGSKPAARAEPQRGQAHPHARRERVGGVAREAFERYQRRAEPAKPASELDDKRAAMLVCAMINAAKADGQLDQKEQDAILGQLGDVTQDEINWVRKQLEAPVDVKSFAWDVPLGLEEEVYGFSLLAIGLDKQKEANYLKELAHGLRIKPQEANELHQQFGAPTIF